MTAQPPTAQPLISQPANRTMTGNLFSLIALPLSLLGHLLFWSGSAELLRGVQVFSRLEPVSFVLTVAGILLVCAAIATVAVGSLGAIIIGALHVAFSAVLFVFPVAPRGGFAPAFDLLIALRSVSPEISDGMFSFVPPGIALITGAIFLAAGLAARARRPFAPSVQARVLSAVAGVVGVVGLVIALGAGARLYVSLLVTLAGPEVPSLLLLVLGCVLVALAVYASRWSSAGAFVAGAVTAIAGLVGLAAPLALARATFLPQDLRRASDIAGPSGVLLLIGLLLVVAGLAARVRARRTAGLPLMASRGPQEPPPPAGAPSV